MRRASQVCVVVFWLVMNGFLVQSEFGIRHLEGIPIPKDLVWRKLVEASDPSMLALTWRDGRRRVGSFKWVPTTLETGLSPELRDPDVEGMAQGVAGYSLDLDGNALIQTETGTNHLRVSMHLKMDTNRVWSELYLQLALKPDIWIIEASALTGSVRLRSGVPGVNWERTFTKAAFSDPRKLLGDLAGGMVPEFLAGMALLPGGSGTQPFVVEARRDHRLGYGSQKVRCLRLQATLFGKHQARLYVNPQSGEILRLDLPGEFSLTNETLL